MRPLTQQRPKKSYVRSHPYDEQDGALSDTAAVVSGYEAGVSGLLTTWVPVDLALCAAVGWL